MPCNRRQFLSAVPAALAAQAPPDPPPNLILILADDLGYGDVGCFGQRMFATPNLDRMAAEGIRFTQAYAGASVCAPSRCCLMTGMHTGHATIRANRGESGRIPLRPDDVTVAEVLKKAAYRTGIIGKWGLGEAGSPGIPNAQGFDYFFGFLNQDHALEYYPSHLWRNRTEFFPPGNQGAKRQQYVQDLFTDRALRFVRENRSNPFFLYLAYTVPHAQSELGRDTGDGFVVPSYEPYQNQDWPRPEKGFAAMVHRLDHDVGRIIQEVRSLGMESNTCVLFTSDNGPAEDGGHTPDFFGSRGGLRGMKGTVYEGGIRVPAIARWPGRIPAGKLSSQVWSFWDILPTAAEIAGLSPPSGIDGRSFLPALFGGDAGARAPLYWEQKSGGFTQAVRLGDWKGVRHGGREGRFELYHLGEDREERRDRSAERTDIVRELSRIMREQRLDNPEYPVPGNIVV
jgi:arylsulfatase A-like enzyme